MHTHFLLNIHHLLILLAAVVLTGCSAAGFQGRTTVIVVTATPPLGGQAAPSNNAGAVAQPTATLVAANPGAAAPVVQPTATLPAAGAAVLPPTNTPAAAVANPGVAAVASPTPSALLPATGALPTTSLKQLMDFIVVDPNGNPLGEVKDVVVNRKAANNPTGQIPYLIIESNLREDWLIPVPWQKSQFRTDLMAIVLPVNANQFLNAPAFNKDFWPGSFTAQQAALQNYWNNPGAAAPPTAGMTQPGALQASDYIRADDLLGIDFLSQQGLKLGEIKDLAIDWQNSQPASAQSGQFGYVVLELDDNISMNKVMVPVPWRFVNPLPGQNKLMVNFTPNLLQTAPNFVEGLMPNLYSEPLLTQLNTFWSGK